MGDSAETEVEEKERRIELSDGWYIDLVFVDRGGPKDVLQGFVGCEDVPRDSASLQAALGLGHLTGDAATPIPDHIMAELEQYEEDYA